jgi:hypothetical protein
MTKLQRKLAEKNGTLGELYAEEVSRRIRERYSINNELSILRQRDEKPEEFAAYNAFAEECKRKAKADVYGEEGSR